MLFASYYLKQLLFTLSRTQEESFTEQRPQGYRQEVNSWWYILNSGAQIFKNLNNFFKLTQLFLFMAYSVIIQYMDIIHNDQIRAISISISSNYLSFCDVCLPVLYKTHIKLHTSDFEVT